MATAVLNTDSLGANGAEVTVDTETLVTLYVVDKTGTHNNHRVMLEVSPDSGTTWVSTGSIVRSGGCASLTAVCTKVRAKVIQVEGATSTVDVWVLIN